jgi:hypothetical protein
MKLRPFAIFAERRSLMPRIRSAFAFATLCSSVALLASGCGDIHSWGVHGEAVAVHLDFQSAERDGRVFLVLAASGCSGGSSGGRGGSFRGRIYALDKREIAWSCRTRDGVTGAVTIDGQKFDLGKGGVFLVSTADKQTKVHQLAVDMTKFQPPPGPQGAWVSEKLQTLGGAEPQIADFFKPSK